MKAALSLALLVGSYVATWYHMPVIAVLCLVVAAVVWPRLPEPRERPRPYVGRD